MRLNAPSCYQLRVEGGRYTLLANGEPSRFTAPASLTGVPKLYTVADGQSLLYVGIAIRSMAVRLRDGFLASGKTGYWGYKWKGLNQTVHLTVWTGTRSGAELSRRDLEAIEAEVAFLCRNHSGQWPSYQNEIHFQPSERWHRDAAARIYQHLTTEDTSCAP